MKNKKRLILFVLAFGLFTLSGCAKTQQISSTRIFSDVATYSDSSHVSVSIQNKTWCAEISRSDEARTHGLSDRESLAPNSGMLFLFYPAAVPTFWMKDMHFDLDFVWILDHEVVDITRNVPHPEGQVDAFSLPRYTPKTKIDSILEVPAGDAGNIKIGDGVIFYPSCAEIPSS